MGTMEDDNIGSMAGNVVNLLESLKCLETNGLNRWRYMDTVCSMPTNLASGLQTVIDGFMGSVFTAYNTLSGTYAAI